jgi:hypothetical protein
MFKGLLQSILFIFAAFTTLAQNDSNINKHLRISLLTCAPGEEIWESFGHTGVRVIDSVQRLDIVYNYGTFGFDKDFEIKFMRGRLLYWVSVEEFSDFTREYIDSKRQVEENVLQLTDREKDAIWRYLDSNAQPSNRYYKYDFYFDNCATRIRDIFPRVLGKNFEFGKTIAANNKLSFRDITNQYLARRHWELLGVNILLGSKIDKVMTNEEIMFLPDYLRDGVGGATVNTKRISTDPVVIISGEKLPIPGVDQPFFVMLLFCLLTAIGLMVERYVVLGKIMSFIALFISGLLGCIILVMWFWTDHKACSDNYNLLWALPTNLFLAFAPKRKKGKYALIAILLLIVSLGLHVAGIQKLPILELGPFLLSLLLVYGTIYRKNRSSKA